MKLTFKLEPRMSDWGPQQIFNDYYEWFKNENTNIEIEFLNIDKFEKTCCGLYSPHVLEIRNNENKKYFLINYWDRPGDFLTDYNGWDPENLIEHFTSAGVTKGMNVTPISYCCYSKRHEDIANNIRKPFNEKTKNNLIFRGAIYDVRRRLMDLDNTIITDKKLEVYDYLNEINDNKISLSLNGAAEICNRDIEILSVGSVLLRPKLTQKFHNDLIDGVHYIGFNIDNDPKIQLDIIKSKYEEIKNDTELLKNVSENGQKWFFENGSIESNVNILKKIININKLK